MDHIGFFAALVAAIGNPFGFMDAIIDAVRTVRDGGERAYHAIDEAIGKAINKPLWQFMLASAAGFALLLWSADFANKQTVDAAHAMHGIYSTFALVSLIGLASIVTMALVQRWLGEHKPQRVSFFMSGFVLTTVLGTSSILLLVHALMTNSSWLFFISAVMWYLTLAVIAVVASVLSFIIRKGVNAVETILELTVEPTAAILPGTTLQNAHGRLRGLLNIIEEDLWGAAIVAVPATIALLSVPFHVFVSMHISTKWAQLFGSTYLIVLLIGWGASMPKVGIADEVNEKRKKFFRFMLSWAWIAALVIRGSDMLLGQALSKTISARANVWHNWTVDFWQGRANLVGNHGWWSVPLLVVFVILTMGMISSVGKVDAKKWKIIGVGIPLLGILYFAFAIRTWVNDQSGWTPFSTISVQTEEWDASKAQTVGTRIASLVNRVAGASNKPPSPPPTPTATTAATAIESTAPPTPAPSAEISRRTVPPKVRVAQVSDEQAERDFDALVRELGVE